MIDYELVLKKFKEYVNNFDTKDENINRKISHSYHVADLCGKLSKRLNLKEEEIILSKTIGILHDIGRFTQFEKTNCYDDLTSKIDHAELAVDYLFKDNHIKDFKIPSKYYKIIEKSIFNHNKLRIENNLNKEELFWSKFIRDIDKIDIFRVCGTNFQLEFMESVSNKVQEKFNKDSLIDRKDINNDSDNVVSYLGFVYDIEFKESYELLNDSDNLELFISSIIVDKYKEDEFNKYVQEIRNYLKSKLEE